MATGSSSVTGRAGIPVVFYGGFVDMGSNAARGKSQEWSVEGASSAGSCGGDFAEWNTLQRSAIYRILITDVFQVLATVCCPLKRVWCIFGGQHMSWSGLREVWTMTWWPLEDASSLFSQKEPELGAALKEIDIWRVNWAWLWVLDTPWTTAIVVLSLIISGA